MTMKTRIRFATGGGVLCAMLSSVALVGTAAAQTLRTPRAAGNAADTQSPSSRSTLAIVGGRLIDGFGGAPFDDAVILVDGNRISAIGHVGALQIPPQARVIHSDGMTVLPGLWESHGHLMHAAEGRPTEFDAKFKDKRIEVMAAVAKVSLLAGITTFRDTGGPLEEQQTLRAEIEAGKRIGPRLFLAGPILNQRERNAPATPGDYLVGTPEEARAMAERLIAAKVDQIKVYGFWSQPILEEITAAAHRAKIGVDADVRHIEAYRTAIKAGVDRLHHVFTADPLSDYSEEDFRLLVRGEKPLALGPSANILRGPYIVPTVEMRRAYARAIQFPEIVDNPRFRHEYPPDLYAYLQETWRNPQSIPWGVGAVERVKVAIQKLHHFIEVGGREQIVAGCDAGSPLNFHSPLAREVANLVEAGLTPLEAIQAATLRPATMQGVEATLGTIAVGKLADIIVVDGDPLQNIEVLERHVVHVIKDGKVYKLDGNPVGPAATVSQRQ
jgi:imidazolonepropionase-like amidohydrolase